MKKLLGIFTVILILTASCTKDELRSNFDESYDSWKDFKKAKNNSYSYTATTVSWTGFSTETKIVVKDGLVKERIYNRYNTNGWTGPKTLEASWKEDASSLNSHSGGAEILTLDQVYEKAKNIWLKADKDKNEIYFEEKNNGMISTCGYVPKDCMDDCFIGIKISEISAL